MKLATPAKNHYVDNKAMFDALVDHKKKVKAWEKKKVGHPPQIPEYIGECLLQIATRLAHKANFASYTFKDDMISDAVENGLLYLHNFDPAKSKNPFAYFTQITHFAFIRRIEREKRHVYTKYKYAMHQTLAGADHFSDEGGEVDLKHPTWMSYENVHNFIRDYETKLARPKNRKTLGPIPGADDEVVSLEFDDIRPSSNSLMVAAVLKDGWDGDVADINSIDFADEVLGELAHSIQAERATLDEIPEEVDEVDDEEEAEDSLA